MGFGFDESTPVVAGGGKKINTMGINVVKISKLEVVSNDLGTYLDVEVVNKQGQTANQRYYEPIVGKAGVTEENIGWKTNAIIAQIKNIASMYMPANYTVPPQPTFAAFLNKIVGDIGTKINNVDVKTVIVYNNKDFPSLRQYGLIFESLNNTDPTKALVLNDKDKLIRSQGMSPEEIISTIKEDKNNDLPF